MLAQVTSGAVLGVDAYLVSVEVDIAQGLPCTQVVGLPESAVREGRERVAAALQNSGFELPARRVTINLAPAAIRKDGSAFDLPIAVGMLLAAGLLKARSIRGVCLLGELGLDGGVRPVPGVLPLAIRCRAEGMTTLIVPAANAREAAVVEEIDVRPAGTLVDVAQHLRGAAPLPRFVPGLVRELDEPACDGEPDFADVHGQLHARRALEIAAAGSHNVLLSGPPGAGKSMLARRLPSILPPLTGAEALETTKIHSVAGRLGPGGGLVVRRPFRAPHHTISDAGLIGGGGMPRPGEVSLAHNGVLFLDELPEFRRSVLETLRQPLEEGTVHIGRARIAVSFPARFTLVAAMNPCPCGHHGSGARPCACAPGAVQRYLARVSGPLLDRIDMHVPVPPLRAGELLARRAGEPSSEIRSRVAAARERQQRRFGSDPAAFANGHMRAREVRRFCRLDERGEAVLRRAVGRLGLSARAAHRVLKLARTIADLDECDGIAAGHVAEAVQYRVLDRRGSAASPDATP